MTEIKKLIELWNARPPRVEPDDDEHLIYIFTGLLPALREAMPRIVELIEQPAIGCPNTDLPPTPAPESNIHTQVQTLNMADSVEASDPTADTGDKPASSPASAVENTGGGAATKRLGASRRARTARAKKHAADPPRQPQETGETATA